MKGGMSRLIYSTRYMRKGLLCLLLIVSLMMQGCENKKEQVLVSVYPIAYLVERIGGEYVECEILSDDMFIQRAQIKANYLSLLENSDIFFYLNSLEPYMELYIDDIRDSKIEMYDLMERSAIYEFKRYTYTSVNGVEAVIESPYYDHESFNVIETYEKDPLLWLDPVLMTSMGSDVCAQLSKLYPQYQSIFESNYEKLELDLARLEAQFQSVSTLDDDIKIVSMTPSFGNWQKAYGISVYPIILSKYGALPSEEQLNYIKEKINRDHVRYIACESNLSKDLEQLREKLIAELGLIEVNIENLSSISKEDLKSGHDYISVMYHNLEVLQEIAK